MKCPRCGKPILDTYWVCPHCQAELKKPTTGPLPPTPPPPPPSRRKLVREIAVFLAGFAVFLLVMVWLFASFAPPSPERARVVRLIGYSLAGAAAWQIACAVLLAITRHAAFAWAGAATVIAILVAWLFLGATTTSAEKATTSALLPGLAALFVIHRVSQLKDARDD